MGCREQGEPVELSLVFHMLKKHIAILDISTNSPVADIDREKWRIKKEYRVDVAPGMEMVVEVMVIADRLRTLAKEESALSS